MEENVTTQRLVAQHLARPGHDAPRDVVAWMGAVQAQDHAASLWAIGQRMRRPSLTSIERAIERGDIVRTWPMRGTLHFVRADEVHAWVELLAGRALRKAAKRERDLGLTPRAFATARRTLQRALAGGERLTRGETYAALEGAGVPTSGQRGIHVLGHLAHEGLLCLGPHEGKQPTFVLLDEWVPRGAKKLSLASLAARYLQGHAPARDVDLAWWLGIPLGEAREAMRAATPPRARRVAPPRAPHAWLLPAFDEYAVGYKDRSAALARVPAGVANPQIGLLSPSVIVDGQMVGAWGRTLGRGDRLDVRLRSLVPWTRGEREAIHAAAQRYADFLGLDARIHDAP